jgi:hypothetical protein
MIGLCSGEKYLAATERETRNAGSEDTCMHARGNRTKCPPSLIISSSNKNRPTEHKPSALQCARHIIMYVLCTIGATAESSRPIVSPISSPTRGPLLTIYLERLFYELAQTRWSRKIDCYVFQHFVRSTTEPTRVRYATEVAIRRNSTRAWIDPISTKITCGQIIQLTTNADMSTHYEQSSRHSVGSVLGSQQNVCLTILLVLLLSVVAGELQHTTLNSCLRLQYTKIFSSRLTNFLHSPECCFPELGSYLQWRFIPFTVFHYSKRMRCWVWHAESSFASKIQ